VLAARSARALPTLHAIFTVVLPMVCRVFFLRSEPFHPWCCQISCDFIPPTVQLVVAQIRVGQRDIPNFLEYPLRNSFTDGLPVYQAG
jgi:hypothetical protein